MSRFGELEDEEIEEHGLEIVAALSGLLQNCDQEFSVEGERGLNEILLKAIQSAKIQARDPNKVQEVSRLYEILHSIDKSTMALESLESTLIMLGELEKDLGMHFDKNPESFGERLVGAVEAQKISIGDIGEAAGRLGKDIMAAREQGRR